MITLAAFVPVCLFCLSVWRKPSKKNDHPCSYSACLLQLDVFVVSQLRGKAWSHLPCNAPVMISIYPPPFSLQCNAKQGGRVQCMRLHCIAVLCSGSSEDERAWAGLGLTSRLISHHLLIIHPNASLKFSSDNISDITAGATSMLSLWE